MLNVQFAKKVLTLVMQWVILIEDLIRFGILTLSPLELRLMEQQRRCMYVLLAYVQVKLSVPNAINFRKFISVH